MTPTPNIHHEKFLHKYVLHNWLVFSTISLHEVSSLKQLKLTIFNFEILPAKQ